MKKTCLYKKLLSVTHGIETYGKAKYKDGLGDFPLMETGLDEASSNMSSVALGLKAVFLCLIHF